MRDDTRHFHSKYILCQEVRGHTRHKAWVWLYDYIYISRHSNALVAARCAKVLANASGAQETARICISVNVPLFLRMSRFAVISTVCVTGL